MPPKRAASKKSQTKVAASLTVPADAKLSNNGEKIDAEELLTNGTSLNKEDAETAAAVVDDAKELAKAPKVASKRGRAKNVANELETEAVSSKRPVAKGRGKKKSNENEVIENEKTEAETEEQQEEKQEVKQEVNSLDDAVEEDQEVVAAKGKGKKKAEPKTKKPAKAKETKKVSKKDETEVLQEEEEPAKEEAEEPKATAKKGKASTGRKKKQEPIVKTEEPAAEEEENAAKDEVNEEVQEKAPKKSSRSAKKEKVAAAPAPEAEPPKKKGRTAKKEKPIVDEVEITTGEEEQTPKDEAKPEVKEKKPAKRGRGAAAKTAVNEETTPANGDAEEVLPKKRSRKAPSVEKELVAEKPKRGGRGKKADKVEEKVEEESVVAAQGKEELEQDDDMANGQVKQETEEEVKESPKTVKKPETKSKAGRKRAAPSTNKKSTKKTADEDEVDNKVEDLDKVGDDANGMDEDEAAENESKPSKAKKKKTTDSSTGPLNATNTKYNKEDFDLPPPPEGQTVEEPRFNLKISSWNVAGLRSWLKKEGLKYLDYEQPDIFCLQETKCTTDQLPEEVQRIAGYHPYWLCMPGGYAGVAIYSKIMPINVEYGIGNKEFDDCGRIITAEYEKFFLINVYVPNSGRKLVNLEARMRWEKLFQEFVKNLDSRKPVVICGDMNVSHQEIDLANPKTNTRNAGFTKEERDKMSELLSMGYIDTFRHLYPERKGAYTFWTYMGNARSRNVGWRLDYFIVSERFIKRVVDNCIRSQCLGSDHCPITLFLKL